jgi:hypothetical protein
MNFLLRFRIRNSVHEIARNFAEFRRIKQWKIPHKIPYSAEFQKVTSVNPLMRMCFICTIVVKCPVILNSDTQCINSYKISSICLLCFKELLSFSCSLRIFSSVTILTLRIFSPVVWLLGFNFKARS